MREIIQDSSARMTKSIESFKSEISKLRTGRAHAGILDHVKIDYYGTEMPIQQVANVLVVDARTLMVKPWEKAMVQPIEKAIHNSGLGLNPATSGDGIRIPMPALTEERRKDLIKVLRGEAENARVSIRNIRRDANSQFKELLKNKEISEDEERRLGEEIQKVTDKFIAEIEQILSAKEKDLMEI